MNRQVCSFLFRASLVVVSLVSAHDAAAQQTDPGSQPTPPVQPTQPAADDARRPDPTAQQPTNAPTAPPLLGATDATLTPPVLRSYLIPSVSYYGQLNSNAYNSTQPSNYTLANVNAILGSVILQRTRPRSQFGLGYLGGVTFSSHGGALNSTTQELVFSEAWNHSRWGGVVADQFNYSSQSALLGGSSPYEMAGLEQFPGVNSLGSFLIRNSFRPNQSIFTPVGPRLSNASVAQVDYAINARTTFTTVGNYDLLHFFNSGLIDSYAGGFQTGVSRELTRRDIVAVAYRFNSLWFTGYPAYIRDHVTEVLYGRSLGKHLTLQVGAGPDISFINNGVTTETRVSWTADAALRYWLERWGFGLYYNHGLTGGSGVFLGAVTTLASGVVQRQLSHVWSISFDANYARNTNVIGVATATVVAPAGARFDSVYGGILARRQFGRNSEFFFGYTIRRQTSDVNLCSGGVCGTNLLGNLLNFGLVWRPEQIAID